MEQPRKVKARIIRVVEEIAIIELERDGSIREFIETREELDIIEVSEVKNIVDVLSVWH
jgi:hypothetical protein